jgi:hypothetical protein
MMAAPERTVLPTTRTASLEAADGLRPRRGRPVRIWAMIGALVVAFDIYVYSSWIMSGQAHPTPVGPTPVPTFMRISAWTVQIVGLVGLIVFVYFFAVRPALRERRITLDGYLVIAWLSLYWIDPITNYSQWWVTYNSYLINWGVWAERLPGWMSPGGRHLAEPIIFFLPTYAYAMMGGTMLGCVVMRRMRARWPLLSNTSLVAGTFVFFVVFDVLIEIPSMFLGLWAYPGAIRDVTLFAGHYYQFPLYEGVFLAALWTAATCLRFFRDDRDRTFAERGLDGVTARWRPWIRGLAIVGVVNVLAVVIYAVPIQWFALHADRWPTDITDRSYLLDEFCGPGTEYACPGPATPIPRPTSAHLGPAGELVPARGDG